jgi:hypothetical protein
VAVAPIDQFVRISGMRVLVEQKWGGRGLLLFPEFSQRSSL